ncbi:MAG TPA: MTH938/NDUFAF3 family protein [Candidatus Dormibacteraeota bacterium]
MARRAPQITHYTFGSIRIAGVTYEHDVVIDRGTVRPRRKKPSKQFREEFGHTPLSLREEIPWDCRRLVIGTGALGALPVMVEVELEAARRGVEVISLPTKNAIALLQRDGQNANAILHLTC